MSDSDQPNESVDKAKKALSGSMASAMALKNSNPKVFFGGLGLLLVFSAMLFMGGDDETPIASVGGKASKNVAIGQKYILKNPNSYDDKATIQLVPVPGTIAAYDESEDEGNPCKKIPQGTHVSVVTLQDAYGKKDNFAEVKIEEGPCKDKTGWVLSFDLQ